MAFGVPLTVGMVAVGVALLIVRYRVQGSLALPEGMLAPPTPRARAVMVIFFLTVLAWLAEPLHQVPAAVVAVASATLLFASGLLDRHDLGKIDWSTLILIAGGISVGQVLERSGLIDAAAGSVDWMALPATARIFILVSASAVLASFMSNTATATVLIPLAMSIDPRPSVGVLIAVGASLGSPFVVSTPPNAMVSGEGGVRASDLAWPGFALMLLGCALVSLTGPLVLGMLGLD
jgi:sodium-dependent dicarboxylate transporter 2/3/5